MSHSIVMDSSYSLFSKEVLQVEKKVQDLGFRTHLRVKGGGAEIIVYGADTDKLESIGIPHMEGVCEIEERGEVLM